MAQIVPADDDDAFDDGEVTEEDQYGRARYLERCKELGIVPVSQVLKFLESDELHVMHYGLGLRGAQALCTALLANQILTTIRLTDNNIPDDGVQLLIDSSANSKSITELDLSGNRMGPLGGRAIAQALASRTCPLKSVSLARMKMEDKEGAAIGVALETNVNLKLLDISDNALAERTGHAFGSMLMSNMSLSELDLSWNKLRSKGVIHVAEGLKPNLTLQVLGLAWTGMQDAGACVFGAMLKSNQGLVDVDLSGNGISQEGAKAIAAGVSASSSLAAITLDNNDVRDEAGQAFVEALQANKGLVICRLDNTNTSEAMRTSIDAILAPRRAQQSP